MYDPLTPPDPEPCPNCDGTGFFHDYHQTCDDCPFENRDCAECIEKHDHLIDLGVDCEICHGNGYLYPEQIAEYWQDKRDSEY